MRIFFFSVILVCVLAGVLSLNSCKEEIMPAGELTALRDSILVLNTRLDSLSKTNLQGGGEMDYWQAGAQNRRALKARGIQDPATYISNDLSKHTTLIPVKPVLGGNMAFARISLLGDRWAIASFEDGHVGGSMVLKYSLQDTSLRWKVLDVASEDEPLP